MSRRQGVLTNSAISHVEMAQGKLLPRVVTKPRKAGYAIMRVT